MLLAGNAAPEVALPIPDVVIAPNSPFDYNLRPGGSVTFGLDVGGTDISATDNYFANPVRFVESWDEVRFTGNTVISNNPLKVLKLNPLPGADKLSLYDWDENTYHSNTALPFATPRSKSWGQWQVETGLDRNGTLHRAPVGTVIDVRPNQYEPGRGHAVVFNWDRLDSVEIDLASVVDIGSSFEIYNVLDLDAPSVAGVYLGQSVTVPMVNVTSPTPIGHTPIAAVEVDKEFGAFLIVSDATPSPATGREFFVASDGASTGDGSQSKPWDLLTAMAHPSGVQPGDTIWITGGTYRGGFTSQLSGTAEAPIQVRAWPGESVKLDMYGADSGSTTLTIRGQHTQYHGLEIFSSDPSSRITSTPGSWPPEINRGNVNVLGDHIKLINAKIHDLNKGLGFWSQGAGGEVYGTLIYNNGWTGPDRNHGHGIYSQNSQGTRTFADNIVFNQFRNGFNLYGSSASTLRNFHLEGNVTFNNGATQAGFNGSHQVLIGGGSLATNITVHENFSYIGKNHFQDPDADALTLSARQADGSPLPDWLTFYAGEGLFRGTPEIIDAGTIDVEVIATDPSGESVSERFLIKVIDPSDTIAPTIMQLDVPDDSADVAVDTDLTLSFSEPVRVGNGSVQIRRSSDDAVTQVISARSTAATFSGSQLHIDPPEDLDESTSYYVQVDADAIFDLAGNAFAGIRDETTWNFTTQSSNAESEDADLSIVLASSATVVSPAGEPRALDEPIKVDDLVTYHMRVTNLGPQSAIATILTHSLPPGSGFVSSSSPCSLDGEVVICQLRDLDSGAAVDIGLTLKATQAGVSDHHFDVTSHTPDDDRSNNRASTTTEVNPLLADLAMTITDDVDPILVGGEVTHQISVTNLGPDAAASVVLSNQIPANVSVVSVPEFCVIHDASVLCNLGDVQPSDSLELDLVLRGNQAGQFVNSASVTSETHDPTVENNTASETTQVEPIRADLSVTVSDGAETALLGDELTYLITVTNHGPHPATGVMLTDILPQGVELLSATPNCSGTDGVRSCGPFHLEAEEVFELRVLVRVIAVGTLTHRVEATAREIDPDIVNNTAVDTTEVQLPQADLDLSITGPDGGAVTLNQRVVYSVTVTNHGPKTAANVLLVNDLPDGMVFVSASLPCEVDAGVVTCTLGDREAGAVTQFSIEAMATATGVYSNTAQVNSDTNDPISANNTRTETIRIVDEAATPEVVFVSFNSGGVVGDVPYADEDILAFDTAAETWSMYFDGSNVGLASSDVSAFHIQKDGSILLSFDANTRTSLGLVRDSDIVKFTPSGHGPMTAGSFEWFLDGSDVGLSPTTGDVDAISFTPDGRLVVSLAASVQLSGLRAASEDLIVLNDGLFGAATSGNWELYFEGSREGLGGTNIGGTSLDDRNSDLYLSTKNDIVVNETLVTGRDILSCKPGSSDNATSCSLELFFRGDNHGLASGQVFDGLQLSGFTGLESFGEELVYLSTANNLSAFGMTFADEDILYHDTRTGAVRRYFDGSDVGILTDIDAFHVLDDDSVLMSFNQTTNVSGVGSVRPQDIVRFVPDATGESTAGRFEWYFDGSDVELTSYNEDIDAISFDRDGNLLLSTRGGYAVGSISGTDADVLRFSGLRLGEETAGRWELYFDGSDVALTSTTEDINGISFDPDTSALHLTTLGTLSANGLSASGTDILSCGDVVSGQNTSCSIAMFYDGSVQGISQSLDGIHVRPFVSQVGSEVDDKIIASRSDALQVLLLGQPTLRLDRSGIGESDVDEIISIEIERPDVRLQSLHIDGGSGRDTLTLQGHDGHLDLSVPGVQVNGVEMIDLSHSGANVVTLNANSVLSLTEGGSIEILGDDADKIIFLDPLAWRMAAPIDIAESVRSSVVSGDVVVNVNFPFFFRNLVQANDVNNDGTVSASDALRVINEISARRYSDPVSGVVVGAGDGKPLPAVFYDTSADNRITALDTLLVINDLGRQPYLEQEQHVPMAARPRYSQTHRDSRENLAPFLVIEPENRAIQAKSFASPSAASGERLRGLDTVHRLGELASADSEEFIASDVDQVLSRKTLLEDLVSD